MFKNGLNAQRFKEYVPIIEKEVRNYLSRWGESGQVGLYIIHSHAIVEVMRRVQTIRSCPLLYFRLI